MRPSPLLAACALSLFACVRSEGPVAPRAPAARFVFVAGESALHVRPDEASPAVALEAGGPWVFRRVAQRNGMTVVETVASPERHCASAAVPPDGMRLRFYVTESALRPALGRTLRLQGPEGSLVVQPGVPLNERGELVLGGVRIATRQPLTGATIVRMPTIDPPGDAAERLRAGTHLTLPEGATADIGEGSWMLVRTRRALGSGVRVTASNACMRLDAEVASADLVPVMDMAVGEGVLDQNAPATTLRAGASLLWPDGSRAGRTVAAVPLASSGRVLGAMRCVRVPLRSALSHEGGASVEVCAPTTDFE